MSTLMKNDKTIAGLTSGMKLLWENPNPTSAFASQDITVDSKGGMVFCECAISTGSAILVPVTFITPSGAGGYLNFCDITGSGVVSTYRRYRFKDATHINFGSAYRNADENNSYLIPIRIYEINP